MKAVDVDSKTLPQRPTAGVIQRFDNKSSACPSTTSLGMIARTYPDAIEFSARAAGMTGMIMLIGLMSAAFAFWVSDQVLSLELENGRSVISFLSFPFVIIVFFHGIYSAIKYTRIELYRPKDEPTIFDRYNRKVYRIYREVYPGWLGTFKKWPMKMAEHDWNLIYAEHHAIVNATGSSVTRMHSLIFNVQKSTSDPTVVDSFAIGTSIQMGEVTVPAVWEHIRRFMEENGPHLPPGEVIEQRREPQTFLQCMAATGPYGSNFKNWWRDHTAMMIVGLLFFPITFPMMTLMGIFSWMAVKTARPVVWPSYVLDAIR
ncbi:DUF6708 domain-containing protein [Pseudoduganella albidiflava]|uniref:DUF6708 domain-containing protein n=1 Tax=Pseudoduganella albidiflava TaxID=321983 RepID=A0ABX5S2Z5_9BURK|nr:DUF6708 domain-containing protein [Pseudoduganella albidiflava]QBI04601.1 hypothetical protein EYF70_30085 [Pseudoduganella albidiflava]